MGLEFVEVVLEAEEVFRIEIPDREAERLASVRDLADLVARRVPIARGESCRTRRAFGQVRTVLRRLRVSRAVIAPGASLLALSPTLAKAPTWRGTALRAENRRGGGAASCDGASRQRRRPLEPRNGSFARPASCLGAAGDGEFSRRRSLRRRPWLWVGRGRMRTGKNDRDATTISGSLGR